MSVLYVGPDFSPVIDPIASNLPSFGPVTPNGNTLVGLSNVPGLAGWRTRMYYMRGTDTLGNVVEWLAGTVDGTGAEYDGPNKPISNVTIVTYF